MNREALVKSIEEKSGRNAAEVDTALELVLREIGSVLASGESVSLGGYGVFIPRYDKRHQQRGDNTTVLQDTETLYERRTVQFKPRKDFIALLNQQSSGKHDFS